MRCPAAFPALAFLPGAAIGWRAPELAGWPVLAASLLAWVCALAALARNAGRPFAAAAASGFVAAGALLGAEAATTAMRTSLRQWHDDRRAGGAGAGVVGLEGRLARDATPTEYGARLLVEAEQVRVAARSARSVRSSSASCRSRTTTTARRRRAPDAPARSGVAPPPARVPAPDCQSTAESRDHPPMIRDPAPVQAHLSLETTLMSLKPGGAPSLSDDRTEPRVAPRAVRRPADKA